MRRALVIGGILGAAAAAVGWWRRHPRAGTAWVNRVVDPWLVERGIVDRTAGEIGLIEHIGRRSGTVRLSPVHPVSIDGGFRIIVPLGVASQWARNVLAAGGCRLQVGDSVYELREPRLVPASTFRGIPWPIAQLMDWLGFRYLVLRRVSEATGTLADASPTTGAKKSASPAAA